MRKEMYSFRFGILIELAKNSAARKHEYGANICREIAKKKLHYHMYTTSINAGMV